MPITPERLALAREHASPHMWNAAEGTDLGVLDLLDRVTDANNEIERLRAELSLARVGDK